MKGPYQIDYLSAKQLIISVKQALEYQFDQMNRQGNDF